MDPVERLDRYLLEAHGEKTAVVTALLSARSPYAAAAPFYRALEALGERTPDDALIALRIALTGAAPADERVLALRSIVARARAANGDAAAISAARSDFQKQLNP